MLGVSLIANVCVAVEPARFDIPASDALEALRIFSDQSNEQILYPIEKVRGVKTQPVRGRLSARAALDAMLANTGLIAVRDEAGGAFVIKRVGADEPAPSARDMTLHRGGARDAAKDVVMLSPFEVQSRTDLGYRAANSVSGTRMAMPISELPMNMTAFTEDFIADQKTYDLYDVVKWAPGVHQDNHSPQGWLRYNIRGFNSAAVQRNGFLSFRFIDTTNIARVEVVKGPASLLYGQINPGGVINYITKRPEAEPALRLSLGAGDHRYKHAALDATGPIAAAGNQVFYRAIAMAEEIPQFQRGARGAKYMLAPSATWKISEHAALTFEFEHFERREDMITGGVVMQFNQGVATQPYPGLPWDFSYAGEGDYQDFVSDVFTAEFTARAGEHFDLKATYLDSYWDMEWRATGQGGTGLLPQSFIDAYYPPSAGLTSADAMFRRNRWEHHWGGERTWQVDGVGTFELAGMTFRTLVGHRRNFDTRLRLMQKNNPNVAGSPLYLKPWDLRDPATWDRRVPFGLDALQLASDLDSSSRTSSLYGVISAAAFHDRLRLLGGYARHRIRNDPVRNNISGTSTEPAVRAASIPQGGALFAFTDEISAFASYSESFIANTSMLRVNNIFTSPAAPARGRGNEFGLKLELFNGRVSGTVSAYRVQASPTGIVTFTSGVDPNGTTLFTDVQGGVQLSEGIECDLLFTPAPSVQLIAGFSRCDAIYERHPSNPALDGSALAAAPERTFSLWGKFTPPRGPLAGFTFFGGVNHVGSFLYVSTPRSARAEPYTTIDLGLGYRFTAFDQRWSADVSVKNVANERYYPSSSSWGFPRQTLFSLRTTF